MPEDLWPWGRIVGFHPITNAPATVYSNFSCNPYPHSHPTRGQFRDRSPDESCANVYAAWQPLIARMGMDKATSAWPPEIPPHFLCLCRQRPHRPRAGGEGGSLAGPYVAHLSSLSCFYRRIAPWRDPPVEAARGWTARVAAEPASPPAQGRWGRQSVPPARVGELRENFWRTSTSVLTVVAAVCCRIIRKLLISNLFRLYYIT